MAFWLGGATAQGWKLIHGLQANPCADAAKPWCYDNTETWPSVSHGLKKLRVDSTKVPKIASEYNEQTSGQLFWLL
jgi:hypothetical protein